MLPNAASKKEINRIQDNVKTSNPSLHYQNTQVIPDVNYGYAITSHKAQGSTFNNVYVMEDNIVGSGMSNKETNQSLYVAMTRPRNKLVMFSELKEGEFLTEEQKSRSEPTGESLQPQEVETKEGVSELFKSNPKLASIGTEQQYSQYLDTIFPDSKVKNIVYHGTDNNFDVFEDKLANTKDDFIGYIPGHYFFNDIESAKTYTETDKVIAAVINTRNPFKVGQYSNFYNQKEKFSYELHDSVVGGYFDLSSDEDIKYFKERGMNEVLEYAVPTSKQIHILGSQQDIEGFKNFTESKQEVKEETTETKKDVVSSAVENQIEELIRKGIIKSKCD
jgi:hypothetical protein